MNSIIVLMAEIRPFGVTSAEVVIICPEIYCTQNTAVCMKEVQQKTNQKQNDQLIYLQIYIYIIYYIFI